MRILYCPTNINEAMLPFKHLNWAIFTLVLISETPVYIVCQVGEFSVVLHSLIQDVAEDPYPSVFGSFNVCADQLKIPFV